MKPMEIYLLRLIYNEEKESTRGVVTVEGAYFCYSLEDKVRKVKIPGRTAIPAGRYRCIITYSNRFKKQMLLLVGVPGFEGIRPHGGNKIADTEGCPLLAKNAHADDHISGSMSDAMFKVVKAAIDAGREVWFNVVDTKEVK